MAQRPKPTSLLLFGVLFLIVVTWFLGRVLLSLHDEAGGLPGVSPVRERAANEVIPAEFPTGPDSTPTRRSPAAEAQLLFYAGRLVLPPGTPPDESLVVVARTGDDPDAPELRAPVGADGTFELALEASGLPALLNVDGRHLYLPRPVELDDVEGPRVIELRPRLGFRILGLIRTAEDHELRGGFVEIYPAAEGEDLTLRARTGNRLVRSVPIQKDGSFEARGLDADGPLAVLARAEDFLPNVFPAAQAEPGTDLKLDLEVLPGAVLTGRVLLDEGVPAVGAEVRLAPDPHAAEFVDVRAEPRLTDDSGAFEFRGLPAAQVLVSAVLEGYYSASSQRVSMAEQAGREIVLQLIQGRTIGGRASWEDDLDTAWDMGEGWVTVRPLGSDSPSGPASTAVDGSGGFRFSGLPPGEYDLLFQAKRMLGPYHLQRAETRRRVTAGDENVELQLTQGASLLGRVLTPDGEPIPAFTVKARARQAGSVIHEFENLGGLFRIDGLEEGLWAVTVDAPGWSESRPITVELPRPQTGGTIDFRLNPAGALRGMVSDTAGNPYAGATVLVCSYDSGLGRYRDWTAATAEVRTDVHGEYAFPDLDPGPYRLLASTPVHALSEPTDLEVRAGEGVEGIQLVLREGGSIVGEIYDLSGAPQVDLLIHAVRLDPSDTKSTRTDESGTFRLEHLGAGEWQVWSVPTRRDTELAPMLATKVDVLDAQESFVTLGGKPDLSLECTGRILSAGGGVRATLHFLAQDLGLEGYKTTATDEDGSFQLVLEGPGRYLVQIVPAPGGLYAATIERVVEVPEGKSFGFDLELATGTLEGSVFTPDGNAVVGIAVELLRNDAIGVDGARRTETDEEGRFRFRLLDPGTYGLSVPALEWRLADSDEVFPLGRQFAESLTLEEGEHRDVRIDLVSGGQLKGSVLDEAGAGVKDAAIFVRSSSGQLIQGFGIHKSDENGGFTLSSLAPGTYTVFARTPMGASAESDPVAVVAGESTDIELFWETGVELLLLCADGNRNPVPVSISVIDERGRQVHGAFDHERRKSRAETGGFSLEPTSIGVLRAGQYTVSAIDGSGRRVESTVELSARDEPYTVTLDFE